MDKKTILVVEDSPTEQKMVADSLEKQGYTILTAVDGDEALEKAYSARPSLIVLDVVLPKKNGFQVCRQLKTSADTKDIKILMLTSKSQDSDRFWGLKQGADGYITKPYADEELITHVDRLL